MNLDVYHNKEADQAALKQAYREIGWKQDEINRLELAVEFGRCLKCKSSLDTMTVILCDDCGAEVTSDLDAMYKAALPKSDESSQEGVQ